MHAVNPYKVKSGSELDQLIHDQVMGGSGSPCLPYSRDDEAARRVLAKLKSHHRLNVTVGRTRLRDQTSFARYETDPSDGTEVLAETEALAICRLALLRALKG